MGDQDDLVWAVDAVRRALAAWLHNKPAQQLVIAAMASESVGGDDLLSVKLTASVARAGRQIRDVMWLLSPPPDGDPDPAAVVHELAARMEATAVCTLTAGSPATDLALRCLHDLVAGAWLTEAGVTHLALTAEDGHLVCRVGLATVPPALEPWVTLVRHRAALAEVRTDPTAVTVRLPA
jgi:hypothetical protein